MLEEEEEAERLLFLMPSIFYLFYFLLPTERGRGDVYEQFT
jgi:hypothetical protein